ncbi:MAG: S46 family peptidase [Chitinophagales bacterium]|nr:S46 family peptidase [Chitinophagales bacterium]
MKYLSLLLCLLFPLLLRAQGGMWVPLSLEKNNEKEMKSLGLKIKADDLFNNEKPSIKDAICQFDGGCTGEMISPEGLLLTNHHCGFDAIQQLSTLEKNYVDNGYWAKNRSEELPAEGVTAMFVIRMEDITAMALRDVQEGMAERDRQAQIDKNLQQIKVNTKKEAWQDILFRAFYNGNQYYMFITATYKDVRLVGTPPASIGKFGSDTDNWVWPRHTGDFSMFRVYADKDNKPAAYSPNNVPFKPKHFLPISVDGIKEGDFTLVYGFPGRTDEYLPASAISLTERAIDPLRIDIRDRALKIIDGYMRKDPDVKISYIAQYSYIANGWKKWQGEVLGLRKSKAVEQKKAYEAEFTNRVENNIDWKYRYGNVLPRLNEVYAQIEPYRIAAENYAETFQRNNQLLSLAAAYNPLLEMVDQGKLDEFEKKKPEYREKLAAYFRDYRPHVDQAVFANLAERYANTVKAEWGADLLKEAANKAGGYDALTKKLVYNSVFSSKNRLDSMLNLPAQAFTEGMRKDPAFAFWRSLQDNYSKNLQPKLAELTPQLTLLQRQYMDAQMKVFREKRFFPDANSTLRVTYGKVRGYEPRDAVQYGYQTDLDGVMEKYVPGDYEFDLPARLLELWKNKDYGQYSTPDGRLPVAFIATNHTTGGNSGSPALDAKGNLIGLNFDRVWEGTMSDLNYDPAICRNIMVDARYILFIIDKYAGAGHLLQEMKIVKGKKRG